MSAPNAERVEALAELAAETFYTGHGWSWDADELGPKDRAVCVKEMVPAVRTILASDWLADLLAAERRKGAEEALREFADSRGVNDGDDDSKWWQGHRQAQRECLRDASDLAEQAGGGDRG